MIRQAIAASVSEVVEAAQLLSSPEALNFMEKATVLISECYKKGSKLLICGNGGSLCDAMHFAEELTGVFRELRPALPAIALADPGHMSCVGNDLGFDQVFARSVEALGKEGDILVVLTTSGNSINIFNAVNAARKKRMQVIAFLGKTGGSLRGLCDLEWIVEGFAFSDRIQELHMSAIHIIIEIIEKQLFAEASLEIVPCP